MTKSRCSLFLFFVLCSRLLTAQNIKDQVVEYTVIKLPLTPLPAAVHNYQSIIFAPYEAENKKKKSDYDAEKQIADAAFQKEKEAYPAKLKDAEDRYASEMAAWKKKSVGEKIMEKEVLGENNKPVKQLPPAPYLQVVPLPDIKTSYNYEVLANTYLILDGFTKKPENAVKVEVTIYGYEYTEPRQLSEQKGVTNYANGQMQTTQVNYYHNEFSYRHAMSVKVTGPDGKELFNITPQELNTYKIFKSPESATPVDFNPQMLVKSYEEKALQDNLTFINNLVNDKIGYKHIMRNCKLYFVKSKDETYKDLLVAFNEASAGLKILVEDPVSANAKLQSSIQAWSTALQESDVKNRKARIDKDVTCAICFNLLESYFAFNDVASAEKIISLMNTIDLSSGKRKQKEEYEVLFNDLKKRILINK